MPLSQTEPIRVLVVDDSAFMRNAITRMLESADDVTVVGTACDGLEAVSQAKALNPDVITLDVEMPNMDGLTALKIIKQTCSASVIMLSSLTAAGSETALRALRLGASDIVGKDQSVSTRVLELRDEVLTKIRAVAPQQKDIKSTVVERAVTAMDTLDTGKLKLVAIGCSTGGPPVIESLAKALPADFPLPIVVAQHMPAVFTKTMAERLDGLSSITVVEGEDGQQLEPGTMYIARGGMRTTIKRHGSGMRLVVGERPPEDTYSPSVDALFSSAADATGAATLGIVLTGMGKDGLEGARTLRAKGAEIFSQSASSCVVYGMPRAVAEAGLSAGTLEPASIAGWLTRSAA